MTTLTSADRDRVLGGLYGLLVGDALGVPFEFSSAEQLASIAPVDVCAPPGFRRAHPEAPPGAWSDDGAHALCLLASLLHRDALDLDDLSRRLLNWHDEGYLAVNGLVFDVGGQTARALDALRGGGEPETAGPADERSNGNGSLMRVLPLALWHGGTDRALIIDADRQSLVTHGHLRARICCALYCMWARNVLIRRPHPWQHAARCIREFAQCEPAWQRELDEHIRPEAQPQGRGTGYVVDCLHSARLALEEDSFAAVVQRAIAFGNDTDTTAAVAGGIAGLRFGLSAIPPRWLDHLAEKTTVEPLALALLDRLGMG